MRSKRGHTKMVFVKRPCYVMCAVRLLELARNMLFSHLSARLKLRIVELRKKNASHPCQLNLLTSEAVYCILTYRMYINGRANDASNERGGRTYTGTVAACSPHCLPKPGLCHNHPR